MAFAFSWRELAEAMNTKAMSGGSVKGIVEQRLPANRAALQILACNAQPSIDLRLDGNPRFMRHDVVLLDDDIVLTGSGNFSRQSLQVNDENLVVLSDRALAQKYQGEFNLLWKDAKK